MDGGLLNSNTAQKADANDNDGDGSSATISGTFGTGQNSKPGTDDSMNDDVLVEDSGKSGRFLHTTAKFVAQNEFHLSLWPTKLAWLNVPIFLMSLLLFFILGFEERQGKRLTCVAPHKIHTFFQ